MDFNWNQRTIMRLKNTERRSFGSTDVTSLLFEDAPFGGMVRVSYGSMGPPRSRVSLRESKAAVG